ncbi:hypothetical protein [Limnobacter sp.]|uniref:hypothetical protein n=1 Tax=Limnobacter sp. TaxID=2003368 RepID=UPI0039199BEA
MRHIESFDHKIFWDMPSPKKFLLDVLRAAEEKGGCAIRMPKQVESSNIKIAVEHEMGLSAPQSVVFKVSSSDEVLSIIGRWANQDYLTMHSLGQNEFNGLKVLFLEPLCLTSLNECISFLSEIGSSDTQVCFKVIVLERGINPEVDTGEITTFYFNGSISEKELSAYLLIRFSSMGLEDESGFYRLLVEEFAKFDPFFCEELLLETQEALLNEPERILKEKMTNRIGDCSTPSWVNGMISAPEGDFAHILHHAYLAEHADEEKREPAKRLIQQRMWRASMRALLPWIEERKSIIGQAFATELEDRSDKNGYIEYGKKDPSFPRRTRHWTATEFGSLVAYVKHENLNCSSEFQKAVFDFAVQVAVVRNKISHFQYPNYCDIKKMFWLYDSAQIKQNQLYSARM